MPALANPRREAFAQAIFSGLFRKPGQPYKSHDKAYMEAGYTQRYEAARVNACRLLKNASILARVQELQQEAIQHVKENVDKLVQELNEDRQLARKLDMPSAASAATMGKAKLLGLITDKTDIKHSSTDFAQAKSMNDIGIGLLAQVGMDAPDASSIAQAIEANDILVATLERIRDTARGLSAQ